MGSDAPITLTPGYRVIDRRGQSKGRRDAPRSSYGYGYSYGGGTQLVSAASPNGDRKRLWLLDKDIHQNLTSYGRRMMLSLGRHLYCSYDVVRGAVDELSRSAAASLVPEYQGQDETYKLALHERLYRHDAVCDIAGPPYGMRSYRKLLVNALLFDGDLGTVYVQGPDGRPYLQVIPSHRIASGTDYVEGGPWDGARILEGVILGDTFNPLAYRILTGEAGDTETFVDVPADRMKLSFVPLFPGQVRGFSMVGFGAWAWQDISETDMWEMLAQKNGAMRIFQEWNDEGEPGPGADFITAPTSGAQTSGTPTGLWKEMVDGGTNTYFKASSPNSRIEAVKFDRPASSQQQFRESKLRDALYALGWSLDFSLNPTKIGGAPMRVVVDKINDTLEEIRGLGVEPAVRRFDAYRIAVFLNRGELPWCDDWFNLEYQPQAKKTADRKYDSDVTLQEVRAGLKTRSAATRERGENEEDVDAAVDRSTERLLARAKRIADQYKEDGVTLKDVITLMASPTANGMPGQVGGTGGNGGNGESEEPEPDAEEK